MVDPCSKYGSTVDGGNASRPGFPAYLPSQGPLLASHFGPSSADMQGASSGVLNEDIRTLPTLQLV
ncbi:hypothetical protein SLEP1_g12847 [Rubroshorea leprosula]|uniref:Uncharacterized protein n=1 Tax=Rubroshorea leprosula TaxID=152421 RepID=A0AAV5IIC5_9ROSI|nr:hypothetical protein SLEP1_g12847 [Rubroshorea leprosula]